MTARNDAAAVDVCCSCCGFPEVSIRRDGTATDAGSGEPLDVYSGPIINGRRPLFCAVCREDASWILESGQTLDLKLLKATVEARTEAFGGSYDSDDIEVEKLDTQRIYRALERRRSAASMPRLRLSTMRKSQ